jgi:hypothetical protein
MTFRAGDRVRVKAPRSEYTGCRGTIMPDPNASEQGTLPFGFYVAIDGETGGPVPFLVEDLERLQGARVRRVAADQKTSLTGA